MIAMCDERLEVVIVDWIFFVSQFCNIIFLR